MSGVCLLSFYREIKTLERPLMSPVRANERGSSVEFFYRATGSQHLGKARSFASMIRANERGAFFQFCLRNQLFGRGPRAAHLPSPFHRGQMNWSERPARVAKFGFLSRGEKSPVR